MGKIGFELMTPSMNDKYSNIFSEDYYDNGLGSFEKIINNLPQLKAGDKDLQNGGFYEKAMDIMSNEKLKILSSLNNYFIFKKM